MTVPLIVLAFFSVFVGLIGIPHALSTANINVFEHWLEPVIVKVHRRRNRAWLRQKSPGSTVTPARGMRIRPDGIRADGSFARDRRGSGYIWAGCSTSSGPTFRGIWAERLRPLYTLSFNKWYWDYLLDVKGVEAGKAVNNALWKVDADVVDGGVNGAGWLTRFWAKISAAVGQVRRGPAR